MGVRQRVFLWGGGNVFDGLIQAFLKRYRQQAVQHIQGLCVALCSPRKSVQTAWQLGAPISCSGSPLRLCLSDTGGEAAIRALGKRRSRAMSADGWIR